MLKSIAATSVPIAMRTMDAWEMNNSMDMEDDMVYAPGVEHQGFDREARFEFHPPPPSESEATIRQPKKTKRKSVSSREDWKPSSAPKRDPFGKQSALWLDHFPTTKPKPNQYIFVGGRDCVSLVKRLKESWKPGPETLQDKKNIAKQKLETNSRKLGLEMQGKKDESNDFSALVAYLDSISQTPEPFQNLGKREWRNEDDTDRFLSMWRQLNENEQLEILERVHSFKDAVRRAAIAEDALQKIGDAELKVREALVISSGRSKDPTFSIGPLPPEERLVHQAAVAVQAVWRGARSRVQLKELTSMELVELEAQLCKDPVAFQNRDKAALEKLAYKRATVKLRNLKAQGPNGTFARGDDAETSWDDDDDFKQKLYRSDESLNFPPAMETAWLITSPSMGILQQAMGTPAFENYANRLWLILAMIRAQIIRVHPEQGITEFLYQWAKKMPSYGDDGRISKQDFASQVSKLCPFLRKSEIDQVVLYLDTRMDGFIHVQEMSDVVVGTLTDRRLLLCNMVFECLFRSGDSSIVAKQSDVEASLGCKSRLTRLREFYSQFAPVEAEMGRADAVHSKYKDTPKVNKELFQRLYKKYVPWLDAPEIMWKPQAQMLEVERVKTLDALAIMRIYENYLANGKPGKTARLAVERALASLRAVMEKPMDGNEKLLLRRVDWVSLHAEISASVRDNQTFEDILTTAFRIEPSEWRRYAEKVARKAIRYNSNALEKQILEAETQKLRKLRDSLSARNYEDYMYKLDEALRKIRAALVSVCGTDKNLDSLVAEMSAMKSFGDDRKVSKRDLKAALATYGIPLTKEDFELISLHYDHDNSGFISVDAFYHGVIRSEEKRQSAIRKAAESLETIDRQRIEKKWIKMVRKRSIPEKLKRWQVFHTKPDQRPYWYCHDTGERTWNKPATVQSLERRENNKVGKHRLTRALAELERYREAANRELDVHLDIISSGSNFALALTNAEICSIPATLPSVLSRQLQALWLDRNYIQKFPRALLELESLTYLSLKRNNIKALPIRIGSLRLLRTLSLSHNSIREVPAELGKLEDLRELELDDNRLVKFPEDAVRGLRRLEVLILHGNRIEKLVDSQHAPTCWSSMEKLRWLNLGNNQLGSLPENMCANLLNVTYLNVCDNRLQTLPRSLCSMTKLHRLDAHGNELVELPENIGQLTNLAMLHLQHNSLESLPESLCFMECLVDLRINNNMLSALPTNFGDLTNLKQCRAQCNCISSLPPSIQHLEHLELAWFHQNDLQLLPKVLPSSLRELKLHNNQLEQLPSTLGDLAPLEHLDIAGNNLVTLPFSMRHLRNLSYLRADNNPLEPALEKVVRTGFFVTSDEESYGLLIRKLIDGLRSASLDTRIDALIGPPPEESLSVKLRRSKAAKDSLSLGSTGSSGDSASSSSRSKTWAEQILLNCFRRFSEYEGGQGVQISQVGFRKCMQTIGILLTETEVDRLTARAFHLYDPDETGAICFEPYVASIAHTSGFRETMSGNSKRNGDTSSRHYAVANAVVRFCGAGHMKIALSAAKQLKKQKKQPELECRSASDGDKSHQMNPDRAPTKARRSLEKKKEQTEHELRELANMHEQLDQESRRLQAELEKSQQQARIVTNVARISSNLGSTATSSVAVSSKSSPRNHRDRSQQRGIDELDQAEAKKKELRAAMREKVKQVEAMKLELRETKSVAQHYTEDIEQTWQREREKQRRRLESSKSRSRFQHKGKHHNTSLANGQKHAKNSEELDSAKRQVLVSIFHSCARQHKDDSMESYVARGDMISAASEFYRRFAGGRTGLNPKAWREKLLRTVDEAFTSGYVHKQTGKFMPYDHDEDGLLGMHDFIRFFSDLDRRYQRQQRQRMQEEKQQEGLIQASTQSEVEENRFPEQPRGQKDEDVGGTCFIRVDLLSSNKPVEVNLRDLETITVANLKSKLEFQHAIPKESQILVFNGRRLDDSLTLAESGLRTGSMVKLLTTS